MSIFKPFDSKPISIHAPAKGATKYYPYLDWLKAISIHAPAKGATSACPPQLFSFVNFNPRSREGSDSKYIQYSVCISYKLYQLSQNNAIKSFVQQAFQNRAHIFPGANDMGILCALGVRTGNWVTYFCFFFCIITKIPVLYDCVNHQIVV